MMIDPATAAVHHMAVLQSAASGATPAYPSSVSPPISFPSVTVGRLDDRTRNPCKVFVGGIGQSTVETTLREHFSKYGQLVDCLIVTDRRTGRSRGFGFVTFLDEANVEGVLRDKHKIDEVLVECRLALPREEARGTASYDTMYMPNKLFVGGIPEIIEEEIFREFFAQFGSVVDASLAYDKNNHRPRGFGFIVYESAESVDLAVGRHCLAGKWVEAKRAIPREIQPTGVRGPRSNLAAIRTMARPVRGGPSLSEQFVRQTLAAPSVNAMPNPQGWSPRTSSDSFFLSTAQHPSIPQAASASSPFANGQLRFTPPVFQNAVGQQLPTFNPVEAAQTPGFPMTPTVTTKNSLNFTAADMKSFLAQSAVAAQQQQDAVSNALPNNSAGGSILNPAAVSPDVYWKLTAPGPTGPSGPFSVPSPLVTSATPPTFLTLHPSSSPQTPTASTNLLAAPASPLAWASVAPAAELIQNSAQLAFLSGLPGHTIPSRNGSPTGSSVSPRADGVTTPATPSVQYLMGDFASFTTTPTNGPHVILPPSLPVPTTAAASSPSQIASPPTFSTDCANASKGDDPPKSPSAPQSGGDASIVSTTNDQLSNSLFQLQHQTAAQTTPGIMLQTASDQYSQQLQQKQPSQPPSPYAFSLSGDMSSATFFGNSLFPLATSNLQAGQSTYWPPTGNSPPSAHIAYPWNHLGGSPSPSSSDLNLGAATAYSTAAMFPQFSNVVSPFGESPSAVTVSAPLPNLCGGNNDSPITLSPTQNPSPSPADIPPAS